MNRVVFLILFLISGSAVAGTPTAVQILAKSKAASGGIAWDGIVSMRTVATTKMQGMSGTYTVLVDFRTGRTATHFKVRGTTIIVTGFDGKSGWKSVFGRAVTADHSPDQLRADVTDAYIAMYGWWYRQHAPAAIKLLGARTENATDYWVLEITPERGNTFDLWINAGTWLISRQVLHAGTQNSTSNLADYRSVHGIKIPFHIRSVSMVSGRTFVSELQLSKVAINVPVSAKDFATPLRKRD